MKKVMLIRPPERWSMTSSISSLGLGCIAAYLEDISEVKLLEAATWDIPRVMKEIENFNPDIIGLTHIFTRASYNVVDLAREIKEWSPDVMLIVGGRAASFQVEFLLESGCVDVVVRGEGELTARELVEKGSPHNVQGLSYIENGKIINNPCRELIADLDQKRWPAYHLMGLENKKYCLMEASRGCTFGCDFCAVKNFYGRTYRTRSPESVVKELESLVNDHGIVSVLFADDNFTMDMNRVARICELIIEKQIPVGTQITARVDTLIKNPEVVKLFARAGINMVWMGIESWHKETLEQMKKEISLIQIENAINLLKENNILVCGFFIIGYPNETQEMALQTAEYASRIGIDLASFSILTPLPGTDFFNRAEADGTLLTKNWSEFDWVNRTLSTIPEDITDTYKKVYKKFYFNKEWIESRFSIRSGWDIQASIIKVFFSGYSEWFDIGQSDNDFFLVLPDAFKDWYELLIGYTNVCKEELLEAMPDYNAKILLETDLFSAMLNIQNGLLVDFSETFTDYDFSVKVDNKNIVMLFMLNKLDALSALLLGKMTINARVSQLIDFLHWMIIVQEGINLNPTGPVFGEPMCLSSMNNLFSRDTVLSSMDNDRHTVLLKTGNNGLDIRIRDRKVVKVNLITNSTKKGYDIPEDVLHQVLNGKMDQLLPYMVKSITA